MNRLKELRKQKGLTLVELGEEVNLANNTLSQYERGIREPNISMLIKLADFFNVSVDYLIGRELKNEVFKNYRYYIFNEDYTLDETLIAVWTSEHEIPILNEDEFEVLEDCLEPYARLSQILENLFGCFYQDEISDDSLEKLARILVNQEAFYVEAIERVDS